MPTSGSPQAPVVPIMSMPEGTPLRELNITESAEIVKQRIAHNTALVRQGAPAAPRSEPAPLPAGFYSREAQHEINASADAVTAFAPMRAVADAKIAPLVQAQTELAEQRGQFAEMLRLDEAGRREQLASRIRMRDAVRELVVKCDSAVARAETRVAETDAHLQCFADLDSRITAALADTLRADHGTALPPHLAAAQRDRNRLTEAVGTLHSATAQLRREAETAHAQLDAADKAVAAWTLAVVTARAEQAAEALAAIDDHAAKLRAEITSLGALSLAAGGISLPIMLPHEVRAAVLAPRPEPEIEPPLLTAFRDWAARLAHDAGAEFAEEADDVHCAG